MDRRREGHFARHIRRMRALYLGRRDALLSGLREHAPALEPYNSDAGIHLSAFLPPGLDDRAVVTEASRRGLSPIALSSCYAGKRPRQGLILGFGGSNERRTMAATKTLGALIHDLY